MSEEDRLAADRRERARVGAARLVGILVAVIRAVCGVAALILVAYVVLTIGGANPDNGIAQFVAGWADRLALGFRDLFTPGDSRLRVLVNYGLAALFWLVIGAVLSRILRRLTSPYLIS